MERPGSPRWIRGTVWCWQRWIKWEAGSDHPQRRRLEAGRDQQRRKRFEAGGGTSGDEGYLRLGGTSADEGDLRLGGTRGEEETSGWNQQGKEGLGNWSGPECPL